MGDLSSHLYLGIPAGLALLVVPTVLIESQWRLASKRRDRQNAEEKARADDRDGQKNAA